MKVTYSNKYFELQNSTTQGNKETKFNLKTLTKNAETANYIHFGISLSSLFPKGWWKSLFSSPKNYLFELQKNTKLTPSEVSDFTKKVIQKGSQVDVVSAVNIACEKLSGNEGLFLELGSTAKEKKYYQHAAKFLGLASKNQNVRTPALALLISLDTSSRAVFQEVCNSLKFFTEYDETATRAFCHAVNMVRQGDISMIGYAMNVFQHAFKTGKNWKSAFRQIEDYIPTDYWQDLDFRSHAIPLLKDLFKIKEARQDFEVDHFFKDLLVNSEAPQGFLEIIKDLIKTPETADTGFKYLEVCLQNSDLFYHVEKLYKELAKDKQLKEIILKNINLDAAYKLSDNTRKWMIDKDRINAKKIDILFECFPEKIYAKSIFDKIEPFLKYPYAMDKIGTFLINMDTRQSALPYIQKASESKEFETRRMARHALADTLQDADFKETAKEILLKIIKTDYNSIINNKSLNFVSNEAKIKNLKDQYVQKYEYLLLVMRDSKSKASVIKFEIQELYDLSSRYVGLCRQESARIESNIESLSAKCST